MSKPDPDTSSLFGEHLQGTAILTQEEIVAMTNNGRLIVSDTFDPSSLQATSYDVRVGKKAVIGGYGNELDLTKDRLVIEPGSYAGIISLEKIKLPNNVFAHIGSKRKFSYDGVILLTGSAIDPGYEGHLLFGLYNASTKKVVLPFRNKICNVVFYRLPKEVKPVSPDPYLLEGNFPPDFLTKMANMEVLPWAQISQEVRRIQDLANEVLDLKKQYNDVLEPIKVLTKDVQTVNNTVSRLGEQVQAITGQVGRLEEYYQKNAELINKVSLSVDSLTGKVSDHDEKVRDAREKLGSYGLLVKIAWAIILLFLGGIVSLVLKQLVFSDKTASPVVGTPKITAPAAK